MNSIRFKQVLNKLYLSFLLLSLLLGTGFLLIGIPLTFYDKLVLKKAEECFDSKFLNYSVDLEKQYAWNEENKLEAQFQRTGEKVILFNQYGSMSGPKTSFDIFESECGISGIKLNNMGKPNQHTKFYSNKVILDNHPDYSPFIMAFFGFYGLAVVLFLFRKWVAWLFRE